MIPDLNEQGNLPEGVHTAALLEFKQRYVHNFLNSSSRGDIFLRYMEYCNKIIQYDVAALQWLDGSYTTNKENPSDIDFVTQLDAIKLNDLENDLDFITLLDNEKNKEEYLCDTYIILVYPKEDSRYNHTLKREEYWFKWFGKDREENPKGIIQFDLSSRDHQMKIKEEVGTNETS